MGEPSASVYVLTYGPPMYFGGRLALRALDETVCPTGTDGSSCGDDATEVKTSSSLPSSWFQREAGGRKATVGEDKSMF